jgi:uncharacterized protein (DUF486 family)
MTKQKIFEILITALISAGIAFLTNLLNIYSNGHQIYTNPEIAGTFGAILRGIKVFRV